MSDAIKSDVVRLYIWISFFATTVVLSLVFKDPISSFLKSYEPAFSVHDVVTIATSYAWPVVALLTICRFGNAITRLLDRIERVFIKGFFGLMLEQTWNNPTVEQSINRAKKISEKETPFEDDIADYFEKKMRE